MSDEQRDCGIALIGVGMVSKTYAAAIQSMMPELYLSGVMGSRPASAETFLQQHSQWASTAKAYSSLDDLLSDNRVSMVVLATPPNARRHYVEQLADAGLPVLMEKPLERTLPAAIELVAICESARVACGVVFQHRMRPSAQKLTQVLASDDPGELHAVEICVPWWREQSYYNEPGRGSYERDGGGVMINQAIHTMDLALQFTGPLDSVSALSGTTGVHTMEAEDFVSAGLRFRNGAIGNLLASTACYPGRSESIYLHYEKLSVRLESSLLQLDWKNGTSESFGDVGQSGAGADPMAFSADWHTSVIRDFAEAIRCNAEPPLTARSALPVHAMIDALEKSAKDRGQITSVVSC